MVQSSCGVHLKFTDPWSKDIGPPHAQRLVVRYHLGGLRREELEPYLTHALRRAGCELPLFEPPACQALFQASHGLPRMVSSLAHYALVAAALDKTHTVSAEHVQHACEEMRP